MARGESGRLVHLASRPMKVLDQFLIRPVALPKQVLKECSGLPGAYRHLSPLPWCTFSSVKSDGRLT